MNQIQMETVMTFNDIPLPFRDDPDGNIYVGSSRVLLDTVLHYFKQGMTPEEIVHNFDTITRLEVYASVAYYLHNQPAMDEYLRVRQEEADKLRREFETAQQPHLSALKDRLEAARGQRNAGHVATAG